MPQSIRKRESCPKNSLLQIDLLWLNLCSLSLQSRSLTHLTGFLCPSQRHHLVQTRTQKNGDSKECKCEFSPHRSIKALPWSLRKHYSLRQRLHSLNVDGDSSSRHSEEDPSELWIPLGHVGTNRSLVYGFDYIFIQSERQWKYFVLQNLQHFLVFFFIYID